MDEVANQAALNRAYARAWEQGELAAQSALPSSYDLRDVDGVDYLAPVRLQNPWGSCWAHSLCSSLETNTAIQTGGKGATGLDYAERQLMWVSANPVNSKTTIAGRGVDADQWGEGFVVPFGSGTFTSLEDAQPLSAWQGIASESQGIPYAANDGTRSMTSDWSIPESSRDLSVVRLSDASLLPTPLSFPDAPDANGDWIPTSYDASATEAIKQAVRTNGAVSISYHGIQPEKLAEGESRTSWFNYRYGAQCIPVFHYDASKSEDPKRTLPDHSVSVVGWDDDFSRDNFGTEKPAGDGAFLVRNTWGTDTWGARALYADSSYKLEDYTDESGVTHALGMTFDANGNPVLLEEPSGTVYLDGLEGVDLSGINRRLMFKKKDGAQITVYLAKDFPDSPTWDGYFWLSYYDATIEEPMTSTADVPTAGTYSHDHEYMYDYLGEASSNRTVEGAFDTSGSHGSAANVFVAQSDERLSAVSVSTLSPGSKASIAVYLLPDAASGPTQSATGEPVETTAVTIDDSGYHTVALDVPVLLRKGQCFSVVETIVGQDGGYVPIELATAKKADCTYLARRGEHESYLSSDGGATWTDLHDLKLADLSGKTAKSGYALSTIGNAEIRAYTTDWKADANFVDGTATGVTQTGLDAVADGIATTAPASARTASVTLDVEAGDAAGTPALAIRGLAPATGLSFDAFYDVTLTQTVAGVTTDIGSENNDLIGVSYPFDFAGKGQAHVFGCHAGTAYELATSPNADGEYYVADEAAGTVTVFARRYSTFALAHAAQAVAPTPPATIGPAQASASMPAEATTPATGDETQAAAVAAIGAGIAGVGALLARRCRACVQDV
jgi:C1A family cysteine protease